MFGPRAFAIRWGDRRVVAPWVGMRPHAAGSGRLVRAADRRRCLARRPTVARAREVARADKAARVLVLTVPDTGLLGGLLQHPATAPWLGDRLGPTAVVIPDDHLEPLRKVLKELGIDLDGA